MISINRWSILNDSILNILLKDAVQFNCNMKWYHTEYIILYPNDYGFRISKTTKNNDTWELIMLRSSEIDEYEFYYKSEITDYGSIRGLTDEKIIPLTQAIKEWKY